MEPNEANHDNYLISLRIKSFESSSEACLLSFLMWYSVFWANDEVMKANGALNFSIGVITAQSPDIIIMELRTGATNET